MNHEFKVKAGILSKILTSRLAKLEHETLGLDFVESIK